MNAIAKLLTDAVLHSTLRLIINEISVLEDFDCQTLAKYLRCMLQAILPLDDNLVMQVVNQAIQVGREGNQVCFVSLSSQKFIVAKCKGDQISSIQF